MSTVALEKEVSILTPIIIPKKDLTPESRKGQLFLSMIVKFTVFREKIPPEFERFEREFLATGWPEVVARMRRKQLAENQTWQKYVATQNTIDEKAVGAIAPITLAYSKHMGGDLQGFAQRNQDQVNKILNDLNAIFYSVLSEMCGGI